MILSAIEVRIWIKLLFLSCSQIQLKTLCISRCDLRKQRHLSVDLPLNGDQDTSRLGGSSSPAQSWTDGTMRRGRIIKRPSIDSGINLANVDTYKRASLDSGLDVLQKNTR